MKKFIYVWFFIYFSLVLINATDNDASGDHYDRGYLKRTVGVLPFFNNENVVEYDYLSGYIQTNLLHGFEGNFFTVQDASMDKAYKESGIVDATVSNTARQEIATMAGADIIVEGSFSIIENYIYIYYMAHDMITGVVMCEGMIKAVVNEGIYQRINFFINDLSTKLYEEALTYNKVLLKTLFSDSDENKTMLIEQLKKQRGTIWNVVVKKDGIKKYVTVPFAERVVVFIRESDDIYTVVHNEREYTSSDSVITVELDGDNDAENIFSIGLTEDETVTYRYKPKTAYDVNIKYIKIAGHPIKKGHSFYVDNLAVFTTAGYAGYDIRLGMGLPVMRSRLTDNLYFKCFVAPKVINVIELETKSYLDDPHLKINLALGYEHIFLIKNLMSINIGLEVGIELYYYSFVVKNYERYAFDRMVSGPVSIYYGFPLVLQFFANKKVSLIFGTEFVLRLVLNTYMYNNKVYLEYLDESRGSGFEFARRQVDDYLTLDLFLYDMPVFIGVRVKL